MVTLTRMYRWLVRKAVAWLFAELRAGRPRGFLALLADDVEFRFPGEHSWAPDYRGKEPVRRLRLLAGAFSGPVPVLSLSATRAGRHRTNLEAREQPGWLGYSAVFWPGWTERGTG